MKRVVILGGGIGGITAARELSRRLDGRAEITLMDREGRHYFPPSFPWLALGWREPERLWRPLSSLRVPGVRVRTEEVAAIEPAEHRVLTQGGELPFDHLIVALGAELQPTAIEGFAETAHHPYDLRAAVRLRDALRGFRKGRVLIGISRLPFKCPAAPYETALLLDYHFRERGIRDQVEMSFFTPEPWPTPAAGEEIGKAVAGLLADRGIEFRAKRELDHVEAAARVAHFKEGQERFDLLVAVPPHTTAKAVRESGLAKDGPWIPVDAHTLRTAYDDLYAIGDVAKVPSPGGKVPVLPKAGVFAEAQAKVAARNIAADLDGGEGARWDGHGACFLETGYGRAGLVRGNFLGEGPEPRMKAPARWWHWGKVLLERRWLGKHFG